MSKSSKTSPDQSKNLGGQPTKLTPELQKQIVKYIRVGAPFELVAAMEGLDARTLRKWKAWGRAGKKPYDAFERAVAAARARAGVKAGVQIYAAGAKDWRAKAWWCRTQFPEQFGDKIELNIKDGLNKFVDMAERVLEPTQFTRLLAALTGENSEGAPPEDGGGEPPP